MNERMTNAHPKPVAPREDGSRSCVRTPVPTAPHMKYAGNTVNVISGGRPLINATHEHGINRAVMPYPNVPRIAYFRLLFRTVHILAPCRPRLDNP